MSANKAKTSPGSSVSQLAGLDVVEVVEVDEELEPALAIETWPGLDIGLGTGLELELELGVTGTVGVARLEARKTGCPVLGL